MYLEILDEKLYNKLIKDGKARVINFAEEECKAQIEYELYDSEKYNYLTDSQCEEVKRTLLGWLPYKLEQESFCNQIEDAVDDTVEKLYGKQED